MRRLALSIIAALAVATPAQAAGSFDRTSRHQSRVTLLSHHGRTGADPLTVAEAAAGEYWGSIPCGGDVSVGFASGGALANYDFGGATLPPGTIIWAWATFNTPTGFVDSTQPPSTYTDCGVTINGTYWTRAMRTADFPYFCALVVHEYGHLFGHPDRASDSPRSITYPFIVPTNYRVRPCVARYSLV